jgi:electron transfer flavoprotein alpha subunit
MSSIWTIAEQSDGKLKDVSFELLARGRGLADQLETKLSSVVIGGEIPKEELHRLIFHGADEVYLVSDKRLDSFVCESYSAILVDLIRRYGPHTILAAATSTGRTLMPHVAIVADTGLTADCTELRIDPETKLLLQTRPAIGGNILATIKTPEKKPQMATVRPKSSRPLKEDRKRKGIIIEVPVSDAVFDSRVEVLGCRNEGDGAVHIEEADVIVAGGRGLKKGDNFHLIHELARLMNAAVGASRDAVDRGWISYPHQIGLSGKTVSPRVYLAIGISGSIQQLAGIKTAEKIVSINSDPEANIHKVADLAIVGDLFEVVPELIKQLEKKLGASI